MIMCRSTLTSSMRNGILLALGLTLSSVAFTGGCTDSEPPQVCASAELDYETCRLLDEGEVPDPNGPFGVFEEVCFDGADGCDPCDAEAIVGAAIAQADASCGIDRLDRVILACGPDPAAEDCCYKVWLEGEISCSVPGRPLRSGAERAARVAELRPGSAWRTGAQTLAGVRRPSDPALLQRVRQHWLAAARYEHASIAAFARVGLQLLGLGAPPELVRACQQALADEIRHAQVCSSLAAAYGATEGEAGPLPIHGCVAAGMDLEAVVREAIVEGALGEGAAALEALEAALQCEDPIVTGVLRGIGEDEQRHALLGYRTVQWALLAEPERARAVVRACLRDGERLAPTPRAETPVETEALGSREHGLVSERARARLRRQTWTDVVAPLLEAMLARASERAYSAPTQPSSRSTTRTPAA